MLSQLPELHAGSTLNMVFPHTDPHLPRRVALGWSRETRPHYSWRGLERPDGPLCVFQYTLSGRGVLERRGVRTVLEPGLAFLVEIPDDHHYYLPAGWEPWEFLYLCFDGADLLHHVHWIIEQAPAVMPFTLDHPVMTQLVHVINVMQTSGFDDAETAAEALYRFTMQLRRCVPVPHIVPKASIRQSLQFIAQHYPHDIGIDDLARAAGLSRAHFSRLFHQELGQTPLEYLTGVRLDRAKCLLRGTGLHLEDIAGQCGFVGSSYLGKVFRKAFGITPLAYRRGSEPIGHESGGGSAMPPVC